MCLRFVKFNHTAMRILIKFDIIYRLLTIYLLQNVFTYVIISIYQNERAADK